MGVTIGCDAAKNVKNTHVLVIIRGVNGLDLYFTVTVDHCWIFDSLPTVCYQFVNSLEINVKNNTIFLKLMKFVHIVVSEYLMFLFIL